MRLLQYVSTFFGLLHDARTGKPWRGVWVT